MWFKVLILLKLYSSSLGLYWFELKFMCWYYNIYICKVIYFYCIKLCYLNYVEINLLLEII